MQMERPQRTRLQPKRKSSGGSNEQIRTAAREAAEAAKVAAAAPPAAMDDIFHTTYQKQSLSVVTISSSVRNQETVYGTGFIYYSQNHCSIIVASALLWKSGAVYGVIFSDKSKFNAEIFMRKYDLPFFTLSVEDVVNRQCVTFTNDVADYEAVTIIGAMAGTRFGFNSRLLGIEDGCIPELIGVLGNYKGMVLEPSCEALDSWGAEYPGTEMYFTLACPMQDTLTSLRQIDDEDEHTAVAIISAPIFRLGVGDMIGVIYSTGDCSDVKTGLHAKDIPKYLTRLCGAGDWEENIKKRVDTLRNKWRKRKA